jgi:hypothetical protein
MTSIIAKSEKLNVVVLKEQAFMDSEDKMTKLITYVDGTGFTTAVMDCDSKKIIDVKDFTTSLNEAEAYFESQKILLRKKVVLTPSQVWEKNKHKFN